MKLNPEDRDEVLIELRTAVLGIKGTAEKGMAGDVRDIKIHLERLNGSVAKNTAWRKTMVGIFTATIGALASKVSGLW